MKGIKKLFIALIFLTLFGVTFKVDAKAAIGANSITINEANEPSSWSGTTANFTVDIGFVGDTSAANSVFTTGSENSNQVTFVLRKGTSAIAGASVTVDFINHYSGGTDTQKISINGGTEQDVPASNRLEISIPLQKSSAYTQIGNNTSVDLNVYEALSGASGPVTLHAHPIEFQITYSYGSQTSFPSAMNNTLQLKDAQNNHYTNGSTHYFLMGDQKKFSEYVKPGRDGAATGGYKREGWYKNDTRDAAGSVEEYPSDGNIDFINKIKLNYTFNEDGLVINGYSGTTEVKVAANQTTVDHAVTFATGYSKANVSSVKINGVNIGGQEMFPTATTFKLTTSEIGTPLTIEMNDGQVYSFPVKVVNTSGISFTTPNKTIYKDDTNVPYTPTWTGETPATVTYNPTSSSHFSSTQSGLSLNLNGLSAGSDSIQVTPNYQIEGYTPNPNSKTFTLTVQQANPIEFSREIFVNQDLTVNLKDFLKADSDTMSVTVTNNSGGLVKFNPSSGSNAINKYIISGESSGTKDDCVTVTPGAALKNVADVTVYSKPSMTVETSGTAGGSGSAAYTYTIKMPKGVYHDEPKYWVKDLSKAILVFKSSSSEARTKDIDVDGFSEDSSDKLLKKATKKIDVKTLQSYFRDICRSDEETVSVIAYAVNGDTNNNKGKDEKLKTENREIKVYKISLDTNGNKTSYTVNGDTVYDYFYKIDGVEYTVVAKSSTGKGKVDKTNSVNADNATESTGTATIKLGSSGSGVLGEKRIKVAFSASNTADDTTGGGSDDYDDVPKTGESKADIWILWSVLFISILGAGFMIWKRFGLVRAIAEADEEVAAAEFEEKVNAAKKEKEDKMKMLKDLRNL